MNFLILHSESNMYNDLGSIYIFIKNLQIRTFLSLFIICVAIVLISLCSFSNSSSSYLSSFSFLWSSCCIKRTFTLCSIICSFSSGDIDSIKEWLVIWSKSSSSRVWGGTTWGGKEGGYISGTFFRFFLIGRLFLTECSGVRVGGVLFIMDFKVCRVLFN